MLLVETIDNMLAEVRQAVSFAGRVLRSAPSGCLFTKRRGNIVRYFKRGRGETEGQYLGKGEEKEIGKLEKKAYGTELMKVAQQEETALKKIRKILKTMPDYRAVFLGIPFEKRHLIAPYEPALESSEEVSRIFEKKKIDERFKLITQNGEYVRSKSELIIADRLKAAGISYYYEDPLIMANIQGDLSPCLYWHPDFRVQNVRTGMQYYWEHFGMLDNPEYCANCQNKLEIYARYGYFPGENLIITSESSAHGLNMEYVDCLIDKYLK